ncbi:MAG: energy transducer TonB [Pseudomonadota bacterium]
MTQDSAKLSAMNDITYETIDRAEVRRWTLSAVLVVVAHIVILTAGLHWFKRHNDFAGTGTQPMMVDLESAPPTNEPRKFDVAPGPEMQQAPAPVPERKNQPETKPEQIPPAPVQENSSVVAPVEQKEKPKPEPDKLETKVETPPRPSEAPASRTTAPPQAAEAARANYNGLLSAHLQRYKQYPPSSRAKGEEGVAMLNFTVGRDGKVLDSSLAKSSGSAALDAETLAMIRRAQPLPPFPPAMTQNSITITVPIRYSLR